MKVLRISFLLVLLSSLFCTGNTLAQDYGRDTVHFRIRYVINKAEMDSSFVDNTKSMFSIQEFLQAFKEDKKVRITGVWFRGTASPDGCYEFNQWLSVNRLRSFKKLIGRYVNIPDNIIYSDTSEIPWNEFRDAVAESDMQYRDEILAIIDEESRLVPWTNGRHMDHRLVKLKQLHDGKAWELLKNPILSDLRYGDAVFEFCRLQPKVVSPPPHSSASQRICCS